MALAGAHIISRFRHWRVFGTLTFSGHVPSAAVQRRLLFAYLYKVSEMTGVPFSRLVWVSRHESGEKFGREHYHVLIGGMELKANTGLCFVLNDLWNRQPRCGFARHYRFDCSKNGVQYVTKCLSSRQRDVLAASCYEGNKFGSNLSSVTLSNSFGRCMIGRRVGVLRSVLDNA